MSLLYEPHSFTANSKRQAVIAILDRAKPDRDYYVLLVGAILLSIGAIMTDSIPVLIASMIVAPLAAPIVALSLGLAAGNLHTITRSFLLLLLSTLIALTIAIAAAVLLKNDRVPDILISFNGNRLIAITVAAISGVIAAYGTMRPKVSSAFTGITIAVSLMPPLVATGIGLAPGGTPFDGALSLYLLNILGITIGSTFTFMAFNLGRTLKSHLQKDTA